MKINLVITGRAYHTTESLPEQLELPEGATLTDAIAALDELLPDNQKLPASCVVAISGKHAGTLTQHASPPLADGDELVLIAPVAGG